MKRLISAAAAIGLWTATLWGSAASPGLADATAPTVVTQDYFYSQILPAPARDGGAVLLSLTSEGLLFANTFDDITNKRVKLQNPEIRWLQVRELSGAYMGDGCPDGYRYASMVARSVLFDEDAMVFLTADPAKAPATVFAESRYKFGWSQHQTEATESIVLKKALFADLRAGKLLDAGGQTRADITAAAALLPERMLQIDMACRIDDGGVTGLSGLEAPADWKPKSGHTQLALCPLPYKDIFWYGQSKEGKPKLTRLPIAASATGASDLTRAASTVGAQDRVFFGLPALDPADSRRVYYWYCICDKSGGARTYALACFDGAAVRVLDGFRLEADSNLIIDWDGKAWKPGNKQLWWMFGDILKLTVQPLVGADGAGHMLEYHPPLLRPMKGL